MELLGAELEVGSDAVIVRLADGPGDYGRVSSSHTHTIGEALPESGNQYKDVVSWTVSCVQ